MISCQRLLGFLWAIESIGTGMRWKGHVAGGENVDVVAVAAFGDVEGSGAIRVSGILGSGCQAERGGKGNANVSGCVSGVVGVDEPRIELNDWMKMDPLNSTSTSVWLNDSSSFRPRCRRPRWTETGGSPQSIGRQDRELLRPWRSKRPQCLSTCLLCVEPVTNAPGVYNDLITNGTTGINSRNATLAYWCTHLGLSDIHTGKANRWGISRTQASRVQPRLHPTLSR
jgi:hypothetical protein